MCLLKLIIWKWSEWIWYGQFFFPFSMIIGPLLMKSVNEYDLSEQLKFQTNELNCSIISGSHVLSKVKKKPFSDEIVRQKIW